MNKLLISKHLTIWITLFILTLLWSCAPKTKKIELPEQPLLDLTKISQEFHKREQMFQSGIIKGNGWIFLPDHKKHKIRFILQWSFEDKEPAIRVVGFGPFGITLFEFLALNDGVYLMIPHKNITYYGEPEAFAGQRAANMAARQFAQVVNPWFQVNNIEIVNNPKPFIKANYAVDETLWPIIFEPTSLLPKTLKGPDIEANYGPEPVIMQNKPIMYPKNLDIHLTKMGISSKITIKNIREFPQELKDKAFDKARFLQFKLRPWQELFS